MKKFFSVLLATTMAFSVTACGNSSSNENDEKVLFIGGSGPLTGDYATYGTSTKNGSTIAIEEINNAGGVNGYKLKLVYEDDQADPQQAVQAYASLMDDGMNVTLGGTTSSACVAVSEEANKDNLLMVTPTATQKEATQYPGGFRVCFMDPDQGTYAARFIKENDVGKKIAVLYDKSSDYSVGVYENFKSEAKKLGLEIVETQAFTNQSNTDFSVQLQAVKSSGADLLFLPIYAQEAAYVLTQANSASLDVTFFGVDGLDGVIEKIGESNLSLTEGVMLLTPFVATSQEQNVVSFVTKYKERHGQTPDQFAADAYDAIYTIAEAFKTAGVETDDKQFNEKMISAMTQITVNGVTGTMKWSVNGEPEKAAKAVVIQEGVYVEYKK